MAVKKSELPNIGKEKEAELAAKLDSLIKDFRKNYSDILMEYYGSESYEIWQYWFLQNRNKF
jgi:hypothetical protein